MVSAVGTRKNISVIDSAMTNNVKIEVLQYDKLKGVTPTHMAMNLHYMEQNDVKVRQVVCYMNNGSVTTEAGAMSYYQGPINMVSGVTAGNVIGKMFKGAVTGESLSQPVYNGSGMLVLEPSFKHFHLIELKQGEHIVVDKGMFYCATGGVKVEPFLLRSVSSAVLGGEGFFQISLSGEGIVVLETIVPMEEIEVINLNNDVLKVDGNFAILRTGTLEFTVERSAKTLIGSAVSGEGLVNVYRGTGQVWLAPILKVYNNLFMNGSAATFVDMNTSNTRVSAD